MTQTVINPPPASAPAEDPFRYGWRIMRRDIGDGYFDEEFVPLRLIDLLHPDKKINLNLDKHACTCGAVGVGFDRRNRRWVRPAQPRWLSLSKPTPITRLSNV